MRVDYPRQAYSDPGEGIGDIVGVLWRSAAAVVLFFFLHGFGLIFAGYAVFYAVQINSAGHKYGKVALAISLVALAAVLIGWGLRLQGR